MKYSLKLGLFTRYSILVLSTLAVLLASYYLYYGDFFLHLIGEGEWFNPALGIPACTLCWYARVLMFPILPLSLVGIYKNDIKFTDYIIPLAILGIILDIYHYALQMKWINTSIACTPGGVDCASATVNYFGFITMPFICGMLFLLILIASLYNSVMVRKSIK
jgi:disulfide bond formation protein DsbB